MSLGKEHPQDVRGVPERGMAVVPPRGTEGDPLRMPAWTATLNIFDELPRLTRRVRSRAWPHMTKPLARLASRGAGASSAVTMSMLGEFLPRRAHSIRHVGDVLKSDVSLIGTTHLLIQSDRKVLGLPTQLALHCILLRDEPLLGVTGFLSLASQNFTSRVAFFGDCAREFQESVREPPLIVITGSPHCLVRLLAELLLAANALLDQHVGIGATTTLIGDGARELQELVRDSLFTSITVAAHGMLCPLDFLVSKMPLADQGLLAQGALATDGVSDSLGGGHQSLRLIVETRPMLMPKLINCSVQLAEKTRKHLLVRLALLGVVQAGTLTNGNLAEQAMIELRVLVLPASLLSLEHCLQRLEIGRRPPLAISP